MTPYGGGEWARKQMQREGYESGYQAGRAAATAECVQTRAKEADQHRIEAFAAIRRAAEVARRYDAPSFGPGHNSIPRGQAASIRRAIRAAIGSDKA